MPPKNAQKGGGAASKKTEAKKKDKVIEDKTFGLKNKKGNKQQKYIQQVEKQVKSGGTRPNIDKERDEANKKKLEKQKKLDELNDIFRPVQNLGSKGSDPKSILCAFYKQGSCGKGAKCKFSHDLTIERKAEKRNAYIDAKDETSENWDMDTLNEAISKKDTNKPTCEIICKHFLDAVENGKYGWFWDCPNGKACIYRHALPPGYILKKDRKRMEKQKEDISLEDLIERERAALGHNTTRVTLETFLAWKKKKLKEREAAVKKDTDKKKKKFDKGHESGLTGVEMFTFNPELEGDMEDGDDAFDIRNLKKERVDGEEEDAPEEHFKEIDMGALMSEMLNENTPNSHTSVANPDRFKQIKIEIAMEEEERKKDKVESEKSLENGATCEGAEGGAVDIDEDLFGGDDEDLDDLEDQLEDMNIN